MERFAADWKRHGLQATLHAWTLQAIKRGTGLTLMEAVRLRRLPHSSMPESGHSQNTDGYCMGFLSPTELERYAASDVHELESDFVQGAVTRGDDCFGIFHGKELAAYSWYSTQPTAAEDGLTVSCSKKYVYMYKAFTHPEYRGRRLYALGVEHAVREYLKLGFQGMICYVQPQNLASLKALRRLGCETFGIASYLRRTRWVHHSSGCHRVGFRVAKNDARPQALSNAQHPAPELQRTR